MKTVTSFNSISILAETDADAYFLSHVILPYFNSRHPNGAPKHVAKIEGNNITPHLTASIDISFVPVDENGTPLATPAFAEEIGDANAVRH